MPRTSPYSIALAEAERDRTRSPRASIYVIVFGSCAGPDRAVRGRGSGQRRDRGAPGHATAGGLQMAQTLLRRASGRLDRSASGRTAPEFSPDVVVAIKALACELPAKTDKPAAGSLAVPRPGPRRRRVRHRRLDLGHHDLALAERGCDQALAASVLDLPPRPRLRCQGGPCPRPLRPPLRRHAAAAATSS